MVVVVTVVLTLANDLLDLEEVRGYSASSDGGGDGGYDRTAMHVSVKQR